MVFQYKKQQDHIINLFIDNIQKNISKSLITNAPLSVANNLWSLWNAAWSLGLSHANKEVVTLFSSSSELITFNKKDNKYFKELVEARRRFETVYKNPDGTYNIREYLKSIGHKGTYNKEEVIAEIERKKNELTLKIQDLGDKIAAPKQTNIRKYDAKATGSVTTNVNRNEDTNVSNTNSNNVSEASETKRLLSEEKKRKQKEDIYKQNQERLRDSKLRDKQIPKYKQNTVREIESRRQIETKKSEEQGITLLQQTEFGNSYLKDRLTHINKALNENILNSLRGTKTNDGIISQYFKSDSNIKDIKLADDIGKLIVGTRSEDINKITNQIKLIDSIVLRNNQLKQSNRLTLENKRNEYEIQVNNIKNNINKDKPDRLEVIRRLNRIEELERNIKNIDKELTIIYGGKNKDKTINITDEEKKSLIALKSKVSYNEIDLMEYKKTLNKNIKDINNNQTQIKRIATTELGIAYNLGRLDYYNKNDIRLVKWNNDIEHLDRVAPKNYKKIYELMYKKLSIEEKRTKPFEMMGVVCPVCQERATRDTGYGKGIYKIEDVTTNPQLHIPVHPSCRCFLTPVSKEDERSKTIPVSIFNNNIAKWAAGGTTAILGTALAYKMFARSSSKPKLGSNTLLKNIGELIVENKDQIKDVAVDQLLVALPKLKEIDKLDTPNSEEINNKILEPPLKKEINNNIKESIKVNKESESIDPDTSPTIHDKLNEIYKRVEQYKNYKSTKLSKENRVFLSQFRDDVKLLQKTINDSNDNTFKLAAQYNSLYKLHNEVFNKARLKGIEDNVIANTPIVSSLRNTLDELENSLRKTISLQNKKYYVNLEEVKQEILSNPELQLDYIKYAKRTIQATINRLPLQGVNDIAKELNDVTKLVNDSKNLDLIGERLINKLDKINTSLMERSNLISNTLSEVDINLIAQLDETSDVVNNAIIISDLKEQIKRLQNQLFVVNNLLITKLKYDK